MSNQPLKVLSVCTSLDGGAGRAAYRIHQGVRNHGVDSRMLLERGNTNDPNIITLDDFAPQNLIYKAFDWTRNKVENKIQHIRWNRYPNKDDVFMSDLRSTDIHGALKKLDYDVLHLHWINQRFLPLKALPIDKPIIWTLHDSWPFCGICHYFFECDGYKRQCGSCPLLHSENYKDLSNKVWQIKEKIYKRLNLHIVSPSRWLGDCAKQSALLGHFHVSVIPNCLDVTEFRPLQDDEFSPRWQEFQEKRFEKPFILYGAMNAATDKRKGFANLLFALQILGKEGFANDFELIVFGAKATELKINLAMPIHFAGYVSDTQELVSLYNLASVMVVPSLTENLSCAIMESLSCGTPVVAFDIGGNSDMIEHKKNGYLAKEQDNEDLAKGIMWCLDNNKNNQLGEAARKKVLKEYAYEVVGEKYKKLYESMICSKNNPEGCSRLGNRGRQSGTGNQI